MRSCIRPRLLCLLAAIALTLPGCSYMDGYWKDSKKFYYTHINRPEHVDITTRTVLEGKESALVQRMMVLDGELVKLEKALDAYATPPDGEAADIYRELLESCTTSEEEAELKAKLASLLQNTESPVPAQATNSGVLDMLESLAARLENRNRA